MMDAYHGDRFIRKPENLAEWRVQRAQKYANKFQERHSTRGHTTPEAVPGPRDFSTSGGVALAETERLGKDAESRESGKAGPHGAIRGRTGVLHGLNPARDCPPLTSDPHYLPHGDRGQQMFVLCFGMGLLWLALGLAAWLL